MKSLLLSAITALSLIAFSTTAAPQSAPTLGDQGAQWMQLTATVLMQQSGDNGRPMQIIPMQSFFVVNGKALFYSDAANMTPDQVVAFAKQQL